MISDKDTLVAMFDDLAAFAAEANAFIERRGNDDIDVGAIKKAPQHQSGSFLVKLVRIRTVRDFLNVVPEENISCFYPLLLEILSGGMGSMYDYWFDPSIGKRQREFQETWDDHLNKIANFIMDKSGLSLM